MASAGEHLRQCRALIALYNQSVCPCETNNTDGVLASPQAQRGPDGGLGVRRMVYNVVCQNIHRSRATIHSSTYYVQLGGACVAEVSRNSELLRLPLVVQRSCLLLTCLATFRWTLSRGETPLTLATSGTGFRRLAPPGSSTAGGIYI